MTAIATTPATAPWPVSDEAIVDYGIGSPEVQAAAAYRIAAREAELDAWWRSRPLRTRIRARIAGRLREPRHRVAHAMRALRGIDCERDE